ncbi:hypothetical protein [Sporosarcina sp. JAI121]|uniref:hypothetical protein n=1 Tax=Sporosarcina sp. JAI121 TaxID=2723064 RepID=UPI0015C7E758|nr:hypothetical protein [Sporosarcina sp. JAI121]NYF24920.1 hypothetical protein [Sporosarcina sp. JAI121]
MRKLFNTVSSVTIEEFTSLRINGPYALLKLGPDFAIIASGEYRIEASGTDLTVETLSEEVAVLTFTAITALSVTTDVNKEAIYDA